MHSQRKARPRTGPRRRSWARAWSKKRAAGRRSPKTPASRPNEIRAGQGRAREARRRSDAAALAAEARLLCALRDRMASALVGPGTGPNLPSRAQRGWLEKAHLPRDLWRG